MNKLLAPALLLCLLGTPAFAQAPAGTDEASHGSAASSSAAPGRQEELRTHTDNEGKVVTEDGRKVRTENGGEAQPDNSAEHSGSGGIQDPGSDPGTLD